MRAGRRLMTERFMWVFCDVLRVRAIPAVNVRPKLPSLGRLSRQARLGRCALMLISLVVGLVELPGGSSKSASAQTQTQTGTFSYTGGLQTFTVPDGVTSLKVTAIGAAGGGVGVENQFDRFSTY